MLSRVYYDTYRNKGSKKYIWFDFVEADTNKSINIKSLFKGAPGMELNKPLDIKIYGAKDSRPFNEASLCTYSMDKELRDAKIGFSMKPGEIFHKNKKKQAELKKKYKQALKAEKLYFANPHVKGSCVDIMHDQIKNLKGYEHIATMKK